METSSPWVVFDEEDGVSPAVESFVASFDLRADAKGRKICVREFEQRIADACCAQA